MENIIPIKKIAKEVLLVTINIWLPLKLCIQFWDQMCQHYQSAYIIRSWDGRNRLQLNRNLLQPKKFLHIHTLWNTECQTTRKWDNKYPGTCEGSSNPHFGAQFLPSKEDQQEYLPDGIKSWQTSRIGMILFCCQIKHKLQSSLFFFLHRNNDIPHYIYIYIYIYIDSQQVSYCSYYY